MQQLSSKAGLVLGGSTGIGLAAARALLDAGARVAIVSNDAAANRAALDELSAYSDARLNALEADAGSETELEAAIGAVAEAFGGIDFLVYSAGIQRYGTVLTTPPDVWDEVMAVNLRGAYLAAKFALPSMAARGGGVIVNISSVQASACQTGVAAYAASKAGLLALTRAMALDHAGDNVRVLSICPGSVDTPMLRRSAEMVAEPGQSIEDVLENWGSAHALKRVARPEEIGAVIAFLVSDAASFMTGAEIRIDGGLTAALPVPLRRDG